MANFLPSFSVSRSFIPGRPFLLTLTSFFLPRLRPRLFLLSYSSFANPHEKQRITPLIPYTPTNKMRMLLILGLVAVCTAAPTGAPLKELESYSVEELDELLAEYCLDTDDMPPIATNPDDLLFPSVPTTPPGRTEAIVPTGQFPRDRKSSSASPTLTTSRRKALFKLPLTPHEVLRRSMREIVIRKTSHMIWNDYAGSGCSSTKDVLEWLTNRLPDWTTQLELFRTECIEKESPGAVTAGDISHYIHMAVLSWIHTKIPDMKASDEDSMLSQQVDLVKRISNRALDNANQETYFIDVLTLMSTKTGHNFNAKASKLIEEIEANEEVIFGTETNHKSRISQKGSGRVG